MTNVNNSWNAGNNRFMVLHALNYNANNILDRKAFYHRSPYWLRRYVFGTNPSIIETDTFNHVQR
jgi:hypothetical protein